MADELDPKVSQRYQELRTEEPPRELDQVILAAAHRAADRAHAPLVAPAGRHRWYFAFGAVAVLVLAVAITVQLDRTQLDSEALTVASAPPVSEVRKEREGFSSEPGALADQAPAREVPAPETRKKSAPAAAPAKPQPAENALPPQAAEVARVDRLESRREQSLAAESPSAQPERKEQAPAAPAAEAPSNQEQGQDQSSAVAGSLLGSELQARGSREAAAAAAPPSQATARPQAKAQESQAIAAIAPPLGHEQLFERIAELRREGKHADADKALAEFRQRYPEYRISEQMLKKVERPK